ncbi:hypothetical protein AVEN_162794-1 [Araneus ventricosus]|uniref:Transposase Tc1-like domain-containing protein n=1 Tax=Araneus ventricosus TaxID=182803 RepID=A0A4Y2C7P4_ARAVE|nr:hypothetical protein AVEN_162794-1 [Araneus ventricosus]
MRHQRKRILDTVPLSKAKSVPAVTQLTAQYNAGPSASVSEHTVQWTLLDMGLCGRCPTCVPLLTKYHRQLRQQWARERRDWTMNEWERVVWSDKSQFLIHHIDGRVRVRHLQANSCSPLVEQVIHRLVVVVLCFGVRSHGRLWVP